MQILTNRECREWVESEGLIYQPFRNGVPVSGQFHLNDANDRGASGHETLVSVCQQASQVLFVIEDHSLSYADRRMRLTTLRKSYGDRRPLSEAPGHLLKTTDAISLQTISEIVIGPGSWWSTYIYLAPIQSTMLVWESSLIDLWSDRHSDYKFLAEKLRKTENSP